jgi:hypothetical protein
MSRWYAPPPKPQEDEDEDEEDEEAEEGEVGGDDVALDGGQAAADSIPIDFNSFVPSHNPALGTESTAALGPYVPTALSTAVPDVATLTQDEIFEKAVSASYWAGYWAAMYHVRPSS